MRKKRVLTICGSGVATSVICANKIRNYCEERNINVDVQTISFGELDGLKGDVDVIVPVNGSVQNVGDIPVVPGINLLTGINETHTLEQIYNYLSEEN
ncbi:PTS galactitol transporter subunit IIB [Erysipelothrix sp. HDW6A]|uniref:PTS sugar transporter subunit IIB n=1 Tax=Erysipelothrix sp. HDW6A TaxID=2714928 RepID=UPI00140E2BD6|nr:PTS galactitol transporter subunit IIB [Erysipelothrix sp. HDW6A]QIK56919.1 PTS galactitol transporter subunit IIB [Erysipelothrix sp. HDW6A]